MRVRRNLPRPRCLADSRACSESRGARKTLQDALALGNLGGAEKAAVLGLAGVALLPHHDTPTFFGGKNNLALQAPSGLLERDQVALITEEKNSAGNLAEKRANASFAPIGSAKPPVADAEAYGRFEFKILGRPHSLETLCLRMVGNLAPTAALSASSSENGHSPDDAVDGRIGGYPSRPDAEWSANREKTGCWIELNWPKPQSVRKIVLYDRPNRKDQVTSGIITFSDGTKMGIGVLPNDGAEPLVLEFPPAFYELAEVRDHRRTRHNGELRFLGNRRVLKMAERISQPAHNRARCAKTGDFVQFTLTQSRIPRSTPTNHRL